MIYLDVLAAVIPFVVVPPVARWAWRYATSGRQRRARRFLRHQWKYL